MLSSRENEKKNDRAGNELDEGKVNDSTLVFFSYFVLVLIRNTSLFLCRHIRKINIFRNIVLIMS